MVDKDAVRRAYDELAETYAAHRPEDDRDVAVLDGFLDSLSEPTRVLDAGCGQGTPVLSRLRSSTTAVGIDFSREQLRLAADTAPGAALVQGDMTNLPFDDGAFDGVVAYWSMIHVPMEDHRTVVDEFARVLRPGGRVLLCEGTNRWSGENPDWLDSGVEMQWNIAGADRTREQLRDAGFVVTDERQVAETLEEEDDEAEPDDGGEADGEEDDDLPWTLFSARLDD